MNAHAGFTIAYIEAQWHTDILAPGKQAFARRMKAKGIDEDRIHFFTVPGGKRAGRRLHAAIAEPRSARQPSRRDAHMNLRNEHESRH